MSLVLSSSRRAPSTLFPPPAAPPTRIPPIPTTPQEVDGAMSLGVGRFGVAEPALTGGRCAFFTLVVTRRKEVTKTKS